MLQREQLERTPEQPLPEGKGTEPLSRSPNREKAEN